MFYTKWEKKYEIGHPRIDFEHQIFFDLIAKIEDVGKGGEDEGYLDRTLYELRKYVEFHFVSEENIMCTSNYPGYKAHVELHEKLLETYNQRMMEIALGEGEVEDFVIFLKDWFVRHTLHEDIKFAKFLETKK